MSDIFAIVASGPSLTKDQVDYCKGKAKVIVINDNYKLAPWADYHYGCDYKWWSWHENDLDLLNFRGIKYTQDKAWDNGLLEHFKIKHRLQVIRSESGEGLSLDPKVIHQGANSGYQCINLAYHLGGRKIILLGYDMKVSPEGKGHWFGEHPDNVRSTYKNWIPFYNRLAEHAKQINVQIINCTIDTDLTCFDRQNLEDVL